MMNKGLEHALPPAKNLKRSFRMRGARHLSSRPHRQGLAVPDPDHPSVLALAFQKVYKDAEKRAVSDAAKALAPLWKVSPSR